MYPLSFLHTHIRYFCTNTVSLYHGRQFPKSWRLESSRNSSAAVEKYAYPGNRRTPSPYPGTR
eukprot:1989274-Rhodomonas_salina.2